MATLSTSALCSHSENSSQFLAYQHLSGTRKKIYIVAQCRALVPSSRTGLRSTNWDVREIGLRSATAQCSSAFVQRWSGVVMCRRQRDVRKEASGPVWLLGGWWTRIFSQWTAADVQDGDAPTRCYCSGWCRRCWSLHDTGSRDFPSRLQQLLEEHTERWDQTETRLRRLAVLLQYYVLQPYKYTHCWEQDGENKWTENGIENRAKMSRSLVLLLPVLFWLHRLCLVFLFYFLFLFSCLFSCPVISSAESRCQSWPWLFSPLFSALVFKWPWAPRPEYFSLCLCSVTLSSGGSPLFPKCHSRPEWHFHFFNV